MKMKRTLSDSENDDDVFDDRIKAGSPSQSCNTTDRKKRRGIIEKRRRDRINNSLIELRRLVPSAFEKQVCTRDPQNGSAKLEKAEILQMTVDHLKLLHQKGLNGNYYDPQSLAMDYRTVGYRECAAEVARYLVTVEGMDIQDPLRMRLMSHLQCYSAQRELATKTCQNTPTWQAPQSQYTPNSNTLMPNQHHQTQHQHQPQQQQQQQQEQMTTLTTMTSCTDTRAQSHHQDMTHGRIPTTMHSTHTQMSSTPISHAQTILPPLPQVHAQFPLGVNSLNSMPPVPGMSPSGHHQYSPPSSLSSLKQPYRPWGSELIGY